MKKLLISGLVFYFTLIWEISFSAPIPQIGPLTIKGTIKKISWNPKKFIKKISGASGTLGKDREIPAQYRITLTNTVVDDQKAADVHGAYRSGRTLYITIYHNQDDGFLKKRMVIKVYGYQVNGDEGGDWYSFRKIQIIKR